MEDESHVSKKNPEETQIKTKRKLEPTVLDNFTSLNNEREAVRTRSALNLLKYWLQTESNDNGENELEYALGRLIRGLGSSKIHARCGFYSALTTLLSLKQDISVDSLLEHVEKQLKRVGSNTKSENADICAGQIQFCCSVIRSGLFIKASDDEKKKILDLLISAGKERIYLKLAAYIVISDLLEKLDQKEFETVVFPSIKEELSKPWAEQNIDNLYLMIVLQEKYDGILKSKFLKRFLGTPAVICSESLPHLANILMSIPRVDTLKHPIYNLFSKIIANTEHLLPFMTELNHHVNRPNRNKFLTATKLITNILELVETAESVPYLLTNNYIIQILGSFRSLQGKQKDPEMQKSVHKLFQMIVIKLKPSEISYKVKIAILEKFLFYPGTFIFEKITRSKVIQQITADLNAEGVKKLAELYQEVVLGDRLRNSDDSSSEHWLNNDRLYAARLLVKLVNHQAVNEEIPWKVEQLEFLMHLGLIRDERSERIGSELAASLKETFFRALDMKHSKLNNLCSILSQLVQVLNTIANEDNLDTILRNVITVDDHQLWQKMVTVTNKIANKTKKNGLNLVFQTLFLHMGLQLFNDVKLASDSLKELFICYERTQKKSEDETTENSSDEPLWIEVVTDLFLNLLSHNSHLLRSIINSVFPHLCKYMNATAIHQILSVLDPKNEDNPLSRKNEDGESDEEDDENEEIQNEDDSEKDSDDELQKEDESEDEENIEDEDETVTDKLKMALHQVLLSNNLEDDQESIDLDEMSETEGEKLDEALAEAFKQFKPNLGKNNKKQSKSDETLTHFRVRVLDLVLIYLDSEPSMILALEIMLPLLQALEFSIRDEHQKPLQERLRAILKKLSGLKKFSSVEEVDESVLTELLNSLLDKGTKNALLVQEMGQEISECCIFVVRCSQFLISNEETPKKMKKHLRKTLPSILENALDVYFKKRDCLTPYVFFKNLIQMNWDGNLILIPLLADFCFDECIRLFRRNQALELLRLFVLNHRYLNAYSEKVMATLEGTLKSFYDKTIKLLENFSENPTEPRIREKFVTNLFLFWTAIKSSILNSIDCDWKKLGELIREFRSNFTLSNDAKSAYKNLCSKLGVPNAVTMKPKTIKLSTLHNDDKESVISSNKDKSDDKKKKKNKSRSQEKRKLKKEAKQKRLQSLSEGLGSGNIFSSAKDFPSGENEDIEMEIDEDLPNHEKSSNSKAKKSKNKIDTSIHGVTKKSKKHEKTEAESTGRNENITELDEPLVSEECNSHKKTKKRKNKNKDIEENNIGKKSKKHKENGIV